MSDDRPGDRPRKAGNDRESRLEERLRDNLRRRKDQARARGVTPSRPAIPDTRTGDFPTGEPPAKDGA